MKGMCAQGKPVSRYSSKPILFALTVHSVDILTVPVFRIKTGDMIRVLPAVVQRLCHK